MKIYAVMLVLVKSMWYCNPYVIQANSLTKTDIRVNISGMQQTIFFLSSPVSYLHMYSRPSLYRHSIQQQIRYNDNSTGTKPSLKR